jgi:hypothetical protein
MRSIEFLEYRLPLSTGEVIAVAEADSGRLPVLEDPRVLAAADDVLRRCTRAPREVVDEAKISRPVCAEISTCVIADRRRCTAAGKTKKGPDFPLCWTYAVDPGLPQEVAMAARDLADSVVGAWRDGRYVLMVST